MYNNANFQCPVLYMRKFCTINLSCNKCRRLNNLNLKFYPTNLYVETVWQHDGFLFILVN